MAIIEAQPNQRPVPSSSIRRTQITYCDTIADRDSISGGERYAGRHVYVNATARIYVWDPVVNAGAGAWCCPNGMVWTVANTADRPLFPRVGVQCYRLDAAVYEWWDGTAWRVRTRPVVNYAATITQGVTVATGNLNYSENNGIVTLMGLMSASATGTNGGSIELTIPQAPLAGQTVANGTLTVDKLSGSPQYDVGLYVRIYSSTVMRFQTSAFSVYYGSGIQVVSGWLFYINFSYSV